MITVKVANFPGTVKEVVLAEDATVQEAFTAADITPSGENVTVNGMAADMNTVLKDGDRVISAQGAKGN